MRPPSAAEREVHALHELQQLLPVTGREAAARLLQTVEPGITGEPGNGTPGITAEPGTPDEPGVTGEPDIPGTPGTTDEPGITGAPDRGNRLQSGLPGMFTRSPSRKTSERPGSPHSAVRVRNSCVRQKTEAVSAVHCLASSLELRSWQLRLLLARSAARQKSLNERATSDRPATASAFLRSHLSQPENHRHIPANSTRVRKLSARE
ncbi:hypothetical protein EYF80_056087 [Liparis tanakae]|uniref:Uncharacterized protein n=1 Tax=Liparis tanakae TaxID=230148 RepID=A0A4Z2EYB9_9TELE|nr:hypothetical protein EYF80_056087 [Liparis tanakae]